MNIKTANKNFWTPRMTLSEFERAQTRNKHSFEIVSVIYDDNYPGLPIRIIGIIDTKHTGKKQIVWNQYGECFFYGNRMKEYDLIHPSASQIASAQICSLSLLFIIVVIVCTSLWN
jgi:hypothetical protein